MSAKGRIIGLVIGSVALCLCLAALITGAAAVVYYAAAKDDSMVRRPTGTPTRTTPSATRNPSHTPPPAPTADTTEITTMDLIEQEIIAMRGLRPTGPVERKFLSVAEVRQRTLDEFNEDTPPEEWADTARALAALGLVRPGIDLYDLFLRLYSEGVAGFYDPDTKELVIVSEVAGLNAYEKVTFAHEYNHALQDQNFDIRGLGFSDEGWETDPERAAAVQAMLEGDASLLEEHYKETLTQRERREYEDVVNAFDLSIYFELPDYLLQDFFFPYSQGLDFVRRYYDAGGWARVDEVWRSPPSSTEHILHPERYEAGDAPLPVARPPLTDTLGADWHQIEASVIGEWYTYLILAFGVDSETRLPGRTASEAAEGWGGDSYTVFHNDGTSQTVLAAHWVWDTQADADQFVSAFRDYGGKRFGPVTETTGRACWTAREVSCFYFTGVNTLWILAPDRATVDAVLSQYPDFAR